MSAPGGVVPFDADPDASGVVDLADESDRANVRVEADPRANSRETSCHWDQEK